MFGPKSAPLTPAQLRRAEREARRLVTERDGGVCVKCRRVHPIFGVNFDHRQNRSQGGVWSASNGQLLCGSGSTGCHGFVTEHPAEAWAGGWAVPGSADPLTYPARRWFRGEHGIYTLGWVLYRDDGTFLEINEDEAARRIEVGADA